LLYQQIRAFPDAQVASGAPGLFSTELFLPWIANLMRAYQEQSESENGAFLPKHSKFSKAYYTKKVN